MRHTCTFEYAAPQLGGSVQTMYWQVTLWWIYVASLVLHEYLASGVWASLHKANFILSFIIAFKSLKENHHGLIAMKFENHIRG